MTLPGDAPSVPAASIEVISPGSNVPDPKIGRMILTAQRLERLKGRMAMAALWMGIAAVILICFGSGYECFRVFDIARILVCLGGAISALGVAFNAIAHRIDTEKP